MSVKAMALVWDMQCPAMINGVGFKPNHKYTLVAYADHADHNGKSIYPAVKTIAKKTGYEERSVQRLTHELEKMGVLVQDGQGPRGTNKWFIPFSPGGDKISPLTNCHPDKSEKSLGDIPSGDIPSGDNLTPELKELNLNNNIYKYTEIWVNVLRVLKDERPRAQFETWIEPSKVIDFDGQTLTVATRNSYARDWLENRITTRAQEISGKYVCFVVSESDTLTTE